MLTLKSLYAHFANSNRFRLQDINLHIAPYEKIAIVGESGSGKSMLAQLILGLNPSIVLESGTINFKGVMLDKLDSTKLRALRGKDIAYIPQEPQSCLNPLQKVKVQILESFYLHANELHKNLRGKALESKANAALEALLAQVKLDKSVANAYPFELSGGQKQRVAIAMSVINRPSLLICDEPTTALDVLIQREIMALLSTLSQKSAILFISHDLGIVREFSDSVAVMKEGKIVESAKSKDIFSTPKHEYTKFLIDALSLPKKQKALDSSAPIILNTAHLSVGVSKKSLFKTTHKALISDVNLSLKQGEILGIAGASGSGKSSLALGLLRLLETNGELKLESSAIPHHKSATKRLREYIGIVFQDPFASLSPRFRIKDIIMEGLDGAKQEREAQMQWALNAVGLDSALANAYPFELSGGQKQCVAIARAVVRKPKVLILDEPTSALDKSSQKLILSLLLSLQEQLGISYIFITHDLAILKALSDSVAIVHNGRIVEQDSSQAIFKHPKSGYARALIEAFFSPHTLNATS